MPHTHNLYFADYSKELNELLTKKNATILSDGRQARYFGVEVEVCDYTSDDDTTDYFTGETSVDHLLHPIGCSSQNRTIYSVKRDGSLEGNSFEMVTAPMTMSLLKKLDWDGFFDYIRSCHYRQTDFNIYDCAGIHIHINRNSLKQYGRSVINALLFITEHYHTMRMFSRRSAYTWYEWCGTPSCLENRYNLKNAISHAKNGDYSVFGSAERLYNILESRYQSVNLLSPDTWEIRIFNSTLKGKDMYNILDFVDVLWELCDTPTYTITMDKVIKALIDRGNTDCANLISNPSNTKDVKDDYSWCKDNDDDD